MPDKYGFNILPDHDRLMVKCIEKNCSAEGQAWEWPEDRRKIHFLTHNFQADGENNSVISGSKKTTICRICQGPFEQEKKRGRPRVKCYVCKPE